MAQIDLKDATLKVKGGAANEEVEIKIGEGNLTYNEQRNVEYTLDRGRLDEVRLGDEIPMDVSFDIVWDYLTGPATVADTAVDNVAGYAIAATVIAVDTMAEVPTPGRTFTFAGHSTVYTVQSATATEITMTSGLTDAVTDDEVISFVNTITIEDALKRRGGAASWTSTDSDPCRPYCVDIEILYVPNCTLGDEERITLADFRYESLDHDLREATISCSGRCNVTEALTQRDAQGSTTDEPN